MRGVKYGVYSVKYGWLIDTCAGGDWSWNVEEAVWFDSEVEAKESMDAAEIEVDSTVIFPRVR